MSISGVNTTTAIMVQQLVNLRTQLDDLQRQLSTGNKVETYSGISSQARSYASPPSVASCTS